MAAWWKQRILAYVMAVILPVLRIGYEFPWGADASLAVAGLNALIEISAMVLYAFLVDRIAAQTVQLKKTITTREIEIGQLRAFTRITGTAMQGRSIGTNDLAHFILATGRQSQESPGALAFLHPSVLRATEHVVRTALKQGIGLSVCGEAAGNPASVCLLPGMGVRNLSMNPFHAASIRRFLRQMTLEQMETVARDALGVTTLEEVQQIASNALRELEVESV